MDYTKLSSEAFKLYESFINAGFPTDYAFELTKFCVKEFPMFKNFIVEEYDNYSNY